MKDLTALLLALMSGERLTTIRAANMLLLYLYRYKKKTDCAVTACFCSSKKNGRNGRWKITEDKEEGLLLSAIFAGRRQCWTEKRAV